MTHWARELGDNHRQRDRAASVGAQALVDADDERRSACRQRWPAIVAALQTLTANYNAGLGREAIVLSQGPDAAHPGVTLEAVGPPPATLHIDIDGAELWARTRSPVDPGERVQWIPLDRTDEEIAAYLMQDWMQRL